MEDSEECVRIKLLSHDARLPTKSTAAAAGYDLYSSVALVVPAASSVGGKVCIGHALISTGISAAIPSGCVGRIGSRSGISIQNNVEVGAGWIDPDYRGEIKVELKNMGPDDFKVDPGMRIAQLFIVRLSEAPLLMVKSLPPTERDQKGFGSSGIK